MIVCVYESLNESLAACAIVFRCSLDKTLMVKRLTWALTVSDFKEHNSMGGNTLVLAFAL